MGFFSKFENRMEDTFEGAADKMSKAPITPVQITKKAEKQMRRETMVGAGREYAPTLYTVLVNPEDDKRLFGYYPTLAGQTETYLEAKAVQSGLMMDGSPLVRFVVDEGLKRGKFDVIAEIVAAPIVEQLRTEEFERYGIIPRAQSADQFQQGYGYAEDAWNSGYGNFEYSYRDPEPVQQEPEQPKRKPPLPYVPEEEIDRSIDYGEYTFNSEDFEDYRDKATDSAEFAGDGYDYTQPPVENEIEQEAPTTVTFTDGAGQNTVPDRHAVRARLVDLTYQRAYDLGGTSITLGRETHNDIVIQDINASRKHAELRLNAQGIWTITDLRSMNGTLVNGVSVASHPLYPGDIVTIGKTDFRFEITR